MIEVSSRLSFIVITDSVFVCSLMGRAPVQRRLKFGCDCLPLSGRRSGKPSEQKYQR
jgi:hypothetical protein